MKTETKIKKAKAIFNNRREMESGVDEVARLREKRALVEARKTREINDVLELYKPQIEELKKEEAALLKKLGKWVELVGEKEGIFADGKKSAETALAVYGLRLGREGLKAEDGWEAVAEVINEHIESLVEAGNDAEVERWSGFLRVIIEVNKEALRAGLNDEELAEIGVKTTSKESFFVDAKATKINK